MLTLEEMLLRLGLAVVLGLVIGFEREVAGKEGPSDRYDGGSRFGHLLDCRVVPALHHHGYRPRAFRMWS